MKPSLLLGFLLLPCVADCQTWQAVTTPPGDWVPPLSSQTEEGTWRRSMVSDGSYLYSISGADGSAGVYRSTDGTTWEPLHTVKGTSAYTMATVAQRFIACSGGKVWVGTVPTAQSDLLGLAPLHRLEPGETEWTPSSSGIDGPLPRGLYTLTRDSSTGAYYLGSTGNYVFSSADGTSWTRHTLSTAGTVASLYAKDGVILAGVGETNYDVLALQIWRSTDGGSTWVHLENATAGDRFVEQGQSIVVSMSTLGSLSPGAYASTDLGATWMRIGGNELGRISGNADHIFSNRGRLTNQYSTRQVYSTSSGSTWGELPKGGFASNFEPYDFISHGPWLFALGPVGASGRSLMRIPQADLDLTPVLAVTDHLDPSTALSPTPLNLTVATAGEEPKTYRWEKNGVLLPGFTGPTLQIPVSRGSDTGDYKVTVTDATGARGESSAEIYRYDMIEGGLDPRYTVATNFTAWDTMGASGGDIFAGPDGSLLAFGFANTVNFLSPEGVVQQTLSLSPNLSSVTNLFDSQQCLVREGEYGIGPAAERYQLRRYTADSLAPDPSFPTVIFNSTVNDIAELPGVGYVAIGSFTAAGPLGSTPAPANRVALIRYDGSVDSGFSSNLGSTPTLLSQVEVAGSNLWIRGSFSSWNGTPANNVVRLDASGALAAAYSQGNLGPSQSLGFMKALPSGRMLVKRSSPAYGLSLLRPDGSLDPDFNTGNGRINSTLIRNAGGAARWPDRSELRGKRGLRQACRGILPHQGQRRLRPDFLLHHGQHPRAPFHGLRQ